MFGPQVGNEFYSASNFTQSPNYFLHSLELNTQINPLLHLTCYQKAAFVSVRKYMFSRICPLFYSSPYGKSKFKNCLKAPGTGHYKEPFTLLTGSHSDLIQTCQRCLTLNCSLPLCHSDGRSSANRAALAVSQPPKKKIVALNNKQLSDSGWRFDNNLPLSLHHLSPLSLLPGRSNRGQ